MNLREQASFIIDQKAHVNEDIVILSRISYAMAKAYSEAIEIAGKTEREYNKYRSSKSIEARKEGLAVGEANEIGKFAAETNYGQYREMLAKCKGMKVVLDQIDAMRIAYYRQEKSIDNAITNKSQ